MFSTGTKTNLQGKGHISVLHNVLNIHFCEGIFTNCQLKFLKQDLERRVSNVLPILRDLLLFINRDFGGSIKGNN